MSTQIEQTIRTALAELPVEAKKPWVKLDRLPYIHATDDPNAKPYSSPVVGRFDYMQTADYMLACNPANMKLLIDELAALRKDAARYQWLCNEGANYHGAIGGTGSMSICRGPYILLEPPSHNKESSLILDKQLADSFIDAAIQLKEQSNG